MSRAPDRARWAPSRWLTDLELAAGGPVGVGPKPSRAAAPRPDEPRAAFEYVLLDALARPPCVVAFSGGRDSSALLALAAVLARRHGLSQPVPATVRFAGDPAMEESAWQEALVAELALSDWRSTEVVGQLEVLGATTRAALADHGVLWPPTVQLFVPPLEEARGGTLVTGLGGDEVLGGWRWRRLDRVIRGELRPRAGDLRSATLALAPRPARTLWIWSRRRSRAPWLRPRPGRRFARRVAAEQAAVPVSWRGWVRWCERLRHLRITRASLGALAESAGATAVHPFLDPGVLAALASERRDPTRGERTATLRRLFADVVPERVLERPDKADMTRGLWGPETASLAATIPDSALPRDLVDPDALRAEWARELPSLGSALPLQAAWLASRNAESTAPPLSAASRWG